VTVAEPETKAGLKKFPVTPVPDQVPPVCPVTKLFKLTGDAELQNTPGLVQLALGPGSTLIDCVFVLTHPLSVAV
jgi:hypothetical protein